MPFNVPAQNDALTGGIGNAITHIGVHTLGTEPGTGTNAAAGEASGGSPAYARVVPGWAAASGGQRSNTGVLTFDVPAGTYAFFTYWTALTGNTGNYRGYAPFGGATPLKGLFSVDLTLTNDQLQSVGHGLVDTDRVMLFNPFADTLPTGLAEGTVYFVVASAANTFKVSLTSGGAAVDITAVGGGEGFWQRVIPETFAAQGQVTVAAGQLILDATGL